MSDRDNPLAEALAALIAPIVKGAVREALSANGAFKNGATENGASFLTVKQAAETSALGASTIRLAIRRRQLRAQKVGRRVVIRRTDLETFLEANPIKVMAPIA